jgi:hypothetical protein
MTCARAVPVSEAASDSSIAQPPIVPESLV